MMIVWTGLTYIWWYSCKLKKRIPSKASGRPSNHQLKFVIQRWPFRWWKHWVICTFETLVIRGWAARALVHYSYKVWRPKAVKSTFSSQMLIKQCYTGQYIKKWLSKKQVSESTVVHSVTVGDRLMIKLGLGSPFIVLGTKTPPLKKVFFKNRQSPDWKKVLLKKNFFEEQQILNKNIVFSTKSFPQFFSEKTAESGLKKSFIEKNFFE